MNGASVSLTMTNTEFGVQETHRLSEATSLYETPLEGCQFVKIIVGQDKTWYLRSCDEDEDTEKCEWFETTEKDDFDVPCCLQTFNELIGLGGRCVCSKQCESNYECLPAGGGSSSCVDLGDGSNDPAFRLLSNEPAFSLHQDYFNHVGRLEGVSEELFDTVFKAMGLVLAMQDHKGSTYTQKRKDTQADGAGIPDVRFDASAGNDSFDKILADKLTGRHSLKQRVITLSPLFSLLRNYIMLCLPYPTQLPFQSNLPFYYHPFTSNKSK